MEIISEENTLTVILSGELDHHKCSQVRKKIDARTEQERPELLQLDFEKVRFMDSSGVGLVMGRFRQMALIGGKLRVVNVPEHISKVFRLSGLERLGVM